MYVTSGGEVYASIIIITIIQFYHYHQYPYHYHHFHHHYDHYELSGEEVDVISSSLDFDQLALLVLGNVKEVAPQKIGLKLPSSGWKRHEKPSDQDCNGPKPSEEPCYNRQGGGETRQGGDKAQGGNKTSTRGESCQHLLDKSYQARHWRR